MNRLCFYFNKPAKYREPIYRKMEENFEADWHFGISHNNLKLFDPSYFSNVHYHRSLANSKIKWTKGLIGMLFKDYETYLMAGETRDLAGIVFLIIKKLFFSKKKVYLWTHGWYGKESKKEELFKKLYYSCVDGLFLYGNYARECMIKEGFDSEKLHIIHNSLDYDTQLEIRESLTCTNIYRNHFGNDNPVICFIGRLKAVKKLDMVVSALNLLKERGDMYNLVFIGDGECKTSLKEQVASLKLEEQVWFYGECFDEKTNAELIYNADMCVAPGNVGLTAIHSLMFGCPVITHNDYKWQMPEFEAIKDGITGAFFERDNVDSLAQVIAKWFTDKSGKRAEVVEACFDEIDSSWNPYFQINILKQKLIV